MDKIKITLPDDSVKEFQKGVSFYDIAYGIGRRLAESALAVKVDGELKDITETADNNHAVEFITFDSSDGKNIFWHSASHILAQAVVRLFPDAKYTIGPAIENGFYYDFDCSHTFTPEDLGKIENEIQKIITSDYEIQRKEISKQDALKLFEEKNNNYKIDIINNLPDDEMITVYSQDDFVDLCRGPHVSKTKVVKAVKLISLAGAYWRGDENNKMLQRIYGIAFPKKKELDSYLLRIEEAKKRDHRKIGKELDLFSFHEEGPGFPFWHPKGTVLYNIFMDYIRTENIKHGYSEIMTPTLLNDSLWHRSGHWENFKENMYFADIDEQTYAVKPMNCPGGLLIFKNNLHSYRELPIKNAEMGMVHRHEKSGVLHGLFRVRCFTQDDAHVFCSEEQIRKEVKDIIDYTIKVYKDFSFEDVSVFIATKPEKAIGSDEVWELATESLKDALKEVGIDYKIKEGEGAFYGPKIEFNIKDCLGRNWQCGTIQVDFSMPARFDVTYRGSDGKDHHPVMIHRAIFGSLERFIGIAIEHFAGKFPLWLAPVQISVLSINDSVKDYAAEIAKKLSDNDFRTEINLQNDSLGNKIRLARNKRVPYIIIVGDKEKQEGTLSIKTYNNGNASGLDLKSFILDLKESIKNKSIKTIIEK